MEKDEFRIVKLYDKYIVQIKIKEDNKYGTENIWYGVSIDFKTGIHKDRISQYYLCGFKKANDAAGFKTDLDRITLEKFVLYTDQKIMSLY